MSRRTERIADLLRAELSLLLLREVHDPRISLASVVSVSVSPDLRHAQVRVSVLGDDAASRRLPGGAAPRPRLPAHPDRPAAAPAGGARPRVRARPRRRAQPAHQRSPGGPRVNTLPKPLLDRTAAELALPAHQPHLPDGDAVGSPLALARLLRGLGKSATVWLRDPVPGDLPRAARRRAHPRRRGRRRTASPTASTPPSCSSARASTRTGLEAQLPALPVLNIDHHLGNEHYGAVNWVDAAAPAVRRDGAPASPRALEARARPRHRRLPLPRAGHRHRRLPLHQRHRRARSRPRRPGRAGARPEHVALWLYESRPRGRVRLLGEMLRTLELHERRPRRHRAAHARDVRSAPAPAPRDAEGLVDYPALDRRRRRGGAAPRARRRPRQGLAAQPRRRLDVERIARSYGGGGHRDAAGLRRDGRRARRAARARSPAAGARAAGAGDGMKHGLLLVDKEGGCTSHDVVQEVRRCSGRRRSATAARSIPTPPACCC